MDLISGNEDWVPDLIPAGLESRTEAHRCFDSSQTYDPGYPVRPTPAPKCREEIRLRLDLSN